MKKKFKYMLMVLPFVLLDTVVTSLIISFALPDMKFNDILPFSICYLSVQIYAYPLFSEITDRLDKLENKK